MITSAALWTWITTVERTCPASLPGINEGWIKPRRRPGKWRFVFVYLFERAFNPSSCCVTNRACWEMFPSAIQTLEIWWLIPGQHQTTRKMELAFLVSDEMLSVCLKTAGIQPILRTLTFFTCQRRILVLNLQAWTLPGCKHLAD